jgi:hypothetical protein
MGLNRCVAVVALLGGCVPDPTFFGYWTILSAERGGVTQDDVGFFEILDDSSVVVLLSYQHDGAAFIPDPQPATILGTTSQVEQELGDNYRTKGETYTLYMSPFGERPFDVDDWKVGTATLSSPEAAWPSSAGLADTTLFISR